MKTRIYYLGKPRDRRMAATNPSLLEIFPLEKTRILTQILNLLSLPIQMRHTSPGPSIISQQAKTPLPKFALNYMSAPKPLQQPVSTMPAQPSTPPVLVPRQRVQTRPTMATGPRLA